MKTDPIIFPDDFDAVMQPIYERTSKPEDADEIACNLAGLMHGTFCIDTKDVLRVLHARKLWWVDPQTARDIVKQAITELRSI